MTTFAWRRGYPFKVPADKAGAHMDQLEQKLGRVPNPEDIVKSARAKRSVIHKAFEWDDTKAAHQHRLEQASAMRRSLLIYEAVPGKNEPTESRVYDYVDLPPAEDSEDDSEDEKRRLWDHTSNLLADADTRDLLLKRAKREADSYRRRYAALHELADVFEAMQRAFTAEKEAAE